MEVVRYMPGKKEEWNLFLDKAKNKTFLFHRNYMDYHSHRFTDHSVMVYENGRLIALFPANETNEQTITAHQGLTYGALILRPDVKLITVLQTAFHILQYYSNTGFSNVIYKAFPRIYNPVPSDEMDYALFLTKATLIRRDTALVINNLTPIAYTGNIRREAQKAAKVGYIVKEEEYISDFWHKVLEPNLLSRFSVKPVHSAEEMQQLKNNFTENIRLFVVVNGEGEIVAGTLLFVTDVVIHCQYIAATDNGRNSGALNLLFVTLLNDCFKDKQYFDFGIVNENNGKHLNIGLLAWKERMGARTISHDFYEINTANHSLLQNDLTPNIIE